MPKKSQKPSKNAQTVDINGDTLGISAEHILNVLLVRKDHIDSLIDTIQADTMFGPFRGSERSDYIAHLKKKSHKIQEQIEKLERKLNV